MTAKLGLNARLYRNTGTYAAPVWNEVTHVKDLTLSLEVGEADVSTRGTGSWRATAATLKEASIEFETVWTSDNDDYVAFRDAFLNGTTVELLVLDGPVGTSGSQGLRATCAITNFSRNEPLEEAITINVTAKPTYAANPPSWFVVP